MKVAGVYAFLIATVTLATGEGGAISVFNNGTNYNPNFVLLHTLKHGPKDIYVSPDISPGETKTKVVPDETEELVFSVSFQKEGPPFSITQLLSIKANMPLNVCFKTWGTVDNPLIGQVDCHSEAAHLASDGGAISVTNNGTYGSWEVVYHELKDGQTNKRQQKIVPVNAGETQTFAISKEARDMYVFFTDKRKEDAKTFQIFFSQPVQLCFKLWGTTDVPRVSQTAC